ncbi:MAG: hypothetical protein FWH44_02120, partial [Methanomassiliicoccaceae archaeon]|nr:hypothetical protein [Methanomassiliicoccaceae archaeon]
IGGAGIGGGGGGGITVTITGTGTSTGSAGDGGAGTGTDGSIEMNGGTVTAKGGNGLSGTGAGAGIGGGGAGAGTGGAGGNITVTGGAVTATGGLGGAAGIGAGIGGATGIGATIGIGIHADIRAYSDGTARPAIDAVNDNAGGGFYVNALLTAPLSAAVGVDIYVFLKTNTGTSIGDNDKLLTVPANYTGFAYTLPENVYEDYYLYADMADGHRMIDRLKDSSRDIYSVTDLNGYDTDSTVTGIGQLTVKLRTHAVSGDTVADEIEKYSAELTSNDHDVLIYDFIDGGFMYSTQTDSGGDLVSPITVSWKDLDGWAGFTLSPIIMKNDEFGDLVPLLIPNTKYYACTYLMVNGAIYFGDTVMTSYEYTGDVIVFVTLPDITDGWADESATPGDLLISGVFTGGTENITDVTIWYSDTAPLDEYDTSDYTAGIPLPAVDYDDTGFIDHVITLAPDTKYYFLIVAKNASGEDRYPFYGPIDKFTITLDSAMTDGTIKWSLTNSGSDWADFTDFDGTSYYRKFNVGSPVYLLAEGDSGYEFSYWTGGIGGNTNEYKYEEDTSITVGAVFYEDTIGEYFTLSAEAHTNGTIYWYVGSGISAELASSVTFPKDTVVNVTPDADPGYEFSYWTGSLGGNDVPDSVTMSEDRTVGAVFYEDTIGEFFTLSAGTHTYGTIYWYVGSGIPAELIASINFPKDTVVNVAPDADPGYEFSYWTGSLGGNDVPDNVTMSEDRTVGAVFYEDTAGEFFTLSPGTHTNGAIYWYVGSGIPAELIASVNFPKDTVVSVTPEADIGYGFSYWTGSLGGNDVPNNVTMSEDRTVGAVFYEDTAGEFFTLSPGTHTNGAIYWYVGSGIPAELISSVNFPKDTVVNVTPEADIGYGFSYWTGSLGGNDVPDSVTMSEDRTVGAVFYEDTAGEFFTLSPGTHANGTIYWYVGSGIPAELVSSVNFPKDTVVSVTPDADPGYEFFHWTGSLSGNDVPDNVTMSEDRTVGAVFAVMYHVTVSSDGPAVIEYTYDDWATVAGVIVFGPEGGHETLTLPDGTAIGIRVASDHDGYRVEWDDHSLVRLIDPIYTHTVHEDIEVILFLVKLDEGSSVSILWFLLAGVLIAAMIFWILIIWRKRPIVTGTVTQNGGGIPGVRVWYTINGQEDSVLTDEDGRYTIYVYMDIDFAITAVGYSVNEKMLSPFPIQKKRTDIDFTM